MPFSKIRRLVLLLTFLLVAFGGGYKFGLSGFVVAREGSNLVINTKTPASGPADFSLFWDVWNRVRTYHIDREKFDSQKMVWGAISGMVSALDDPYTTFLPPRENEDFKSDLGGQFEGIGAQLDLKDGRIIVVAPLKGSPAEEAGILPLDIILKVDNVTTDGWTVNQAVSKIRGPKGTTVTLNIFHENSQEPADIKIVRDTIKVPAVEYWVKPPAEIIEIAEDSPESVLKSGKKVAYIHLTRFGDRLSEEWMQAVNYVVSQSGLRNVAGLILDLRNNPGGYLDGSVYIASEFLDKGVVVSQVNSDGTRESLSVNRQGSLTDIKLVVLINKGSASASEIVAGALQDYGRAKIVGETSFGKGSVQTPQDLPGGSGLHITTGKWMTPKDNSISKKGITPDVVVERDFREATRDAQLAKAVELLFQ